MGRASGRSATYSANTTVPGGNTVAGSAAETTFASKYTLPANSLAVGQVLRITAFGVYGTDGALAGTLTLKLKAGSTALASTGALVNVVGLTNRGWIMRALCVVTAIGASGSMEAQGDASFSTALTTALAGNLANTGTISIDTTASIDVGVSAQFSISDSDNAASLRLLLVEKLG